jgi:hypothetical protein
MASYLDSLKSYNNDFFSNYSPNYSPASTKFSGRGMLNSYSSPALTDLSLDSISNTDSLASMLAKQNSGFDNIGDSLTADAAKISGAESLGLKPSDGFNFDMDMGLKGLAALVALSDAQSNRAYNKEAIKNSKFNRDLAQKDYEATEAYRSSYL